MSTEAEAPAHALSDFADLLGELDGEGIDYLIIGGCAVGAYARLAGEVVVSADLDIYLSEHDLAELLAWARRCDVEIEKTPQPRSVPVAVLRWRGLEINALTSSAGLPPAEAAVRGCREFELGHSGARIQVADPYDLLANKLETGRPKDLPHIELLERYLHLEIREIFAGSGSPRTRLAPAKRFLQVRGKGSLPEGLVESLIPFADAPPLRRFLAGGMSNRRLRTELLQLAGSDEERQTLRRIMDESARLADS